jgi:poly(3-hydroxybutyrate) depolymerase
LQPVTDWKGAVNGLPSDVTMKIYVPDKVATKPPVLLVVHYCGGTADAVFGQAQGGGIVKAADQYGFIMVFPSSGRCWDIVSSKTRTRATGVATATPSSRWCFTRSTHTPRTRIACIRRETRRAA